MVLGFDFARACGKLAIWTRAPHIGLAIGTQLGFLCTSDTVVGWDFARTCGKRTVRARAPHIGHAIGAQFGVGCTSDITAAGFAVTNRCHDAFVAPTNDKIIAAIAVRPTDTRGGHAIRGAATHVV